MRVAITGASGLIGSALSRHLSQGGHEVLRLVRHEPHGPQEARWDPHGTVDTAALEGVDAVVHLAGAGVGDHRWTASYKERIRDSRTAGTRTLAEALAVLDRPPRVLVCGSAVGFYGDTGDRETDESGPQGAGFLAGVVGEWEAASAPASAAGIRVVLPRTGPVLSGRGGFLGKVLPLFKLGLGGPLGNGRQWMSWISLPDQVSGLRFLLDRDDVEGPVNLTAPHPVTNAEFTRALGRAVRRPAVLPVPAAALRVAVGGFADEAILVSQRVVPRRLTEAGFTFEHPDVDSAARGVLRA